MVIIIITSMIFFNLFIFSNLCRYSKSSTTRFNSPLVIDHVYENIILLHLFQNIFLFWLQVLEPIIKLYH